MRIVFAIVIALCIFDLPLQAQEEDSSYYQRYETQLKSGILCKRRERVEYRQDTVWRLWIYIDSVSKNEIGLSSFFSQQISYIGSEPLFTHHTTIRQYNHNRNILFERNWWKPSIQDGKSREISYAYDQKGRLIEKKEYKWGKEFAQTDIYSYDDSKRVMVHTIYGDSNKVEYESLNLYDSLFRFQAEYPTFIAEQPKRDFSQIDIPMRVGEVSVSYEYLDSARKVIKKYYDKDGLYLVRTATKTNRIGTTSDSTIISDSLIDRSAGLFPINECGTGLKNRPSLSNNPTDFNRKVYDSNNRLITNGRGEGTSFSGTTYSYNERGDQSEMVTYRKGAILETHKITYTYAK